MVCQPLSAAPGSRRRTPARLGRTGERGVADRIATVLTALLADDIYTTKAMMFEELVGDADLAPRPASSIW